MKKLLTVLCMCILGDVYAQNIVRTWDNESLTRYTIGNCIYTVKKSPTGDRLFCYHKMVLVEIKLEQYSFNDSLNDYEYLGPVAICELNIDHRILTIGYKAGNTPLRTELYLQKCGEFDKTLTENEEDRPRY